MKSTVLIAILSAACAAQTQTLRVVPVHLDATVSIPKTIQFFCTQDYDRQACLKDSVALRHALASYPLDQLGTTDDCGFAPFSDDTSTTRETAFAKIRARVEGTQLAEQILGNR